MGVNFYVCRSYRGKTSRRSSFALPPSWIGLRSVTIKQGWVGFIICKSYVTPTIFILDTFRWCMFYPLDIIYTTCVQNGLVRNDSDISQWTCNLYQLSVWRLYGAFERELIHPEISFCEINFCVYWFLGISRFIGKSAKICLHQIYFMQINPFKVFAEFVI